MYPKNRKNSILKVHLDFPCDLGKEQTPIEHNWANIFFSSIDYTAKSCGAISSKTFDVKSSKNITSKHVRSKKQET